jgi:hypothetical protein
MVCDRQDFDGITADELAKAIQQGWTEVDEVQTYAESCKTYSADEAPKGHSALDWWTHLGWCPDCRAEEEFHATKPT